MAPSTAAAIMEIIIVFFSFAAVPVRGFICLTSVYTQQRRRMAVYLLFSVTVFSDRHQVSQPDVESERLVHTDVAVCAADGQGPDSAF